jgi:hypothetical protein
LAGVFAIAVFLEVLGRFRVSSLGCVLRRLLHVYGGTVADDLFFNRWDLEVLPDIHFGTYQGASVIIRRVFDWKRLRIYVRLRCGAPELFAVEEC